MPRAPHRRCAQALERDPPYGAQVRFETDAGTGGWNAPPFAPWLEQSITRASQAVYGTEAVQHRLRRHHPVHGHARASSSRSTQFFITGVLGPHANAHGPNEFLHLDYAKKLTACVSLVLADHARTVSEGALAHVDHVARLHGCP